MCITFNNLQSIGSMLYYESNFSMLTNFLICIYLYIAITYRDQINMATALSCLGWFGVFACHPSPATGLGMLAIAGAGSGFLGAHMTASIGGADMPVVSSPVFFCYFSHIIVYILYLNFMQKICCINL